MGATLDQIDATMYAALQTIVRPGTGTNSAGPFSFLGRWVGPPTVVDESAIETFGKAPSILLAFEDEKDTDDVATMAARYEFAAVSTWTVMVCVTDPRGAKQVAKGSTGIPGGLALCSTVIAALNGLVIPSPAATLSFAVTGAANATVPIGSQVLIGSPYVFTPTTASVVLDGNGNGTVNATCTFPQWDLGNLNPGSVLTWTPAVAGLGATGRVVAQPVIGENGLMRRVEVLKYRQTQRLGYVAGRILVYGVRFTALRHAEQVDLEDSSQRLDSILSGIYLEQTVDEAPNPVVQFNVETSIASIDDVVLWMLPGNISADGATWNDASRAANDLTQSDVSLRPAPDAIPDALGRTGVTFNGTQWMASASAVDLSSAAQLDVFVVMRPHGADTSGGNAIINNTDGFVPDGPCFEDLVFGGDSYEDIEFGPTLTTSTGAFTAPNVPPDAIHLIEFRHDQTLTTNQCSVFIDGNRTTNVQPSINATTSGGFGNRILAIGRNDNTGMHLRGTVYEIVVATRLLTTPERNRVLADMARRNQLSVTLE